MHISVTGPDAVQLVRSLSQPLDFFGPNREVEYDYNEMVAKSFDWKFFYGDLAQTPQEAILYVSVYIHCILH